MKKKILFIIIILSLITGTMDGFGQEKLMGGSIFSAGIRTGYNRGFGVQADFTVHKLAEEIPFKLRFGIGYNKLDPGNSFEARRIFINNATNGVPEKKGRSFDYRVDFMFVHTLFKVKQSYLVFGPRYSSFTGNFKFIGGNEDFDVTSRQWGIGVGEEFNFRMSGKLDLVISAGLDYYFPGTLTGHDTSYSPDNENVNPRDDIENGDIPFTYKDADKAINQPKFMPRVMIGLNYYLK